MTKSTITREQLEEWVAQFDEDGGCDATDRQLEALIRQSLAAMDSEPVILYRERNPYNGLTTGWQELTENEFSFLKENAGENAEFLTLYRHAQPVVPDGLVKAVEFYEQVKREDPQVETGAWKDAVDWVLKEACCAAMPAPASQENN
ncbi:TPA: hypothetical protein OL739_002650 [Klebsiella pneumoniae]|nr:hypothetical protein [Klebsiella pneumoniae]HDY8715552.1 hypothetical protein [Klebsiella pneumoniae]